MPYTSAIFLKMIGSRNFRALYLTDICFDDTFEHMSKKGNFMKKLFLLAALLLACPVPSISAKEEVSESITWAFFKLTDIFGPDTKCEEWIDLMQEMEGEFKERQAEIQRDQESLRKAGMEYQKKEQAKLLNDQSREAELRKLQDMQNRLQQKMQKFDQDTTRKQQTNFEALVQKIKSILDRLKKQYNIKAFIVDSGWAVDADLDYTDEIIRELNEDYRKAKKAREAKKVAVKPAPKK